jgi:trimethylamine--corrinoid protein Co-methyltransferase
VASDSKLVDAQAGMESGMSAMMGALAGINMISGAGMLASLACHSIEKLVIDAEIIASAQRLAAGIEVRTDTLATAMVAQAGLKGDFLSLKETRALFRGEQHFPSTVIDRNSDDQGQPADVFCRARRRVRELLESYSGTLLTLECKSALLAIASREAKRIGLDQLPGIH